MSNLAVIACKALSKTYQEGSLSVPVLHQLQLEVPAGTTVGIMGASGSGKSTLLHLLGGLDSLTEGAVFWSGTRIDTLNEHDRCMLRNKHLGFIYQLHHLLPEFTALENVMLPLLLAKYSHAQAVKTASEMLAQVGLSHRLQHKVSELSGGERQRTAIARALVNQPKCILADEPTGNLDRENAELVFKLMLDLCRDAGLSLVMVTHDPHLAEQLDVVYDLSQDGLIARES
jgi:lipoprotein-releasing system ATP-binding protein